MEIKPTGMRFHPDDLKEFRLLAKAIKLKHSVIFHKMVKDYLQKISMEEKK